MTEVPSGQQWQVEQLRLTAFPVEAVPTHGLQWWQPLLSVPAASRMERPSEGVLVEQGPFSPEAGPNVLLTLEVGPMRIDWRVSFSGERADPNQPPIIGPFGTVLAPFASLMHSWSQRAPAIQRLALGAILLAPVENTKAGYARLATFLPFDIDPNSSDFSYQINRSRPAQALDGLEINRLSKWAVARMQSLRLAIGPATPTVEAVDILTACRLEFDVNTSPKWEAALPSQQLPALVDELVGLGQEIAAEGDKP